MGEKAGHPFRGNQFTSSKGGGKGGGGKSAAGGGSDRQVDKRHGGAWDRGSADAYYGRSPKPHFFEGGTGVGPSHTNLTQKQKEDYRKGYEDQVKAGVTKSGTKESIEDVRRKLANHYEKQGGATKEGIAKLKQGKSITQPESVPLSKAKPYLSTEKFQKSLRDLKEVTARQEAKRAEMKTARRAWSNANTRGLQDLRKAGNMGDVSGDAITAAATARVQKAHLLRARRKSGK